MTNDRDILIVTVGADFERFWGAGHPLPPKLLVFSVTQFKIDQNKNQNRSIDRVQNLGNERRYIYEDPRQDSGQMRAIFRIRDIRRRVLPKLIEICMETPCWCSPG